MSVTAPDQGDQYDFTTLNSQELNMNFFNDTYFNLTISLLFVLLLSTTVSGAHDFHLPVFQKICAFHDVDYHVSTVTLLDPRTCPDAPIDLVLEHMEPIFHVHDDECYSTRYEQ